MHMTSVSSSNVQSIGYENGILAVIFLNGSLYHYFDVPEEVFNEFLSASSKGQFLHKKIKNQYRYQKIN